MRGRHASSPRHRAHRRRHCVCHHASIAGATPDDVGRGADRWPSCKKRHPALSAASLLSHARAWSGGGHFLQIDAHTEAGWHACATSWPPDADDRSACPLQSISHVTSIATHVSRESYGDGRERFGRRTGTDHHDGAGGDVRGVTTSLRRSRVESHVVLFT
jgi:hypothetical protein